MGGFRTPAHTQTIDRRWPASENLHQLSRSADDRSASEADVEATAPLGCRGRIAVLLDIGDDDLSTVGHLRT
ncbi:MAG: hypothetical protein ABR878_13965, partial [Roseiarcus sp.]|jgi:hypothetical protein